MRLIRPRFTVRWLMVAVAVAALLLTAGQAIQLIMRDAQQKAEDEERLNPLQWLNN